MSRVAAFVLSFNYGRYLGECLSSIDAQTHEDLRVVVIDDASTDNSKTVINEFVFRTARDVEVIAKPRNLGPADSYNQFISSLQPGDDYVQILDADDWLRPEKIAHQVAALDVCGPATVAVYGDAEHLDDESGDLSQRPTIVVPEGDALKRLLSVGGYIPVNAGLIRADAFRRVHIDDEMRLCDLGMWVQIAKQGGIRHVPGGGAVVRMHGRSMTKAESQNPDHLRILARQPTTREQRRWARRRGRLIAKAAAVSEAPPPRGALLEYGRRSGDPVAIAAAALPRLARSTLRRAARGPRGTVS